jgi:hypothetical protein
LRDLRGRSDEAAVEPVLPDARRAVLLLER